MNKIQWLFLLLVVFLIGACGVPLDEHNAQIQTANLTIENLKATRVEGKAQIATNEAVMAEQALQIRTAQAGQEQVLTELNRLKGNYASLAHKATQKARDYTEKAYALVEVVGTLAAYEEYYSPVPTATPTPTPTPKPYTIRPGIRPVGTGAGEIPPGLYKCTYSDSIYWARLARLGEDTILSNEFRTDGGETYVRIFSTDGAFELSDAQCVQQPE